MNQMKDEMIPVYILNGFLESGKTEFIKFTIAQPYFRSKETTLLLLCEEGEAEYEPELLKKTRTELEVIENKADFTIENLEKLAEKHHPGRIIIEYNGMWNCKELYLPKSFGVEQQITIIDASTFSLYLANMRSLVAEMVRKSELVIFNRCDGVKELSFFKRNIKAVNPRAEIVFEDSQGEINEMMEEELPYDLNADVIQLDRNGFGIWYLDMMEHPERYMGKTVSFTGMVLKPGDFPKNYFVPGRVAMTCCEEDMEFFGYVCQYDGTENLEEKSWIHVTARVELEKFMAYQGGEGPVLHAVSITPEKEPEQPVIDFAAM